MSTVPPITHSVDAEGVAWITFDDPSGRANILNPATLAVLRAILETLAASLAEVSTAIKAVVLVSAKEKIFIAGADLKWLAVLADEETAARASREGQAVFDLVDDFPVPVICAIHGACVGGGYEIALASKWRLASDARETRIGLPEIKLGIIPGWGGCTRLARLIGAQHAAEFILKGGLISSAAAHAIGLIDEVVPVAELKVRAKAAALRLAATGAPIRPAPPAAAPDFFARQREQIALRWRGQPAPVALLEIMEKSTALTRAEALALEATLFGRIGAGEVAKNLIHVFQLKERARKNTSLDAWYPDSVPVAPPAPFRTIGIVGAGVMGPGIAHWCAMQGFGVILCDSNKAAVEQGVAIIRALFADGVGRGKLTADAAHRMMGGIGITTSLEDFEYCDLVIEAIEENLATKQKLFAELSASVRPDCVLASTSAALPIGEIAVNVAHPGRVLGIHFFNPVSGMALVALSLSPLTTRATAERALAWSVVMGKTPVVCRSSGGSLVTRVLFSYLNAACRLCQQGTPIERIERAALDWGWPMGPMRLIDEIGFKVTDAVFNELQFFFPDRFVASTLCRELLAGGLTGRKNGTGTGFYVYGEDHAAALNPAVMKLISIAADGPAAWDEKAIQDHLHAVLLNETRRAVAEGIVKTADDADLALLLGAGFPAFRGGLLRSSREIA